MALRENLQVVRENISAARMEPLSGHPLARLISHEWPDSVAEIVDDPSYRVTGSPGKGNWANTVWLAVFDRMITETAQNGFYLVYLVPEAGGEVFLSLNQGTEEIYRQVGGRHYREFLEVTAARDRELLEGEDTVGMVAGPLDLGASSRLTRGYESGNIFAVHYSAALPSQEQLEDDLVRLLLLYRSLVEARDQLRGEEVPNLNPDVMGAIESKKYRWHKRAERSRRLAKEAKRFHGYRCQVPACGKDLSEIYGEPGIGYIEAHHLTPFSALEGRPTSLDPRTDFSVVCPDCHRMIHSRAEPFSLEELSAQIELQKNDVDFKASA